MERGFDPFEEPYVDPAERERAADVLWHDRLPTDATGKRAYLVVRSLVARHFLP